MSISSLLRRFAATVAATMLLATGGVLTTAAPAAAAPGTAATLPPIGSVLCHVGQTTGLRCGTLVAVNLTIVFPTGVVTGVFRYTACAEPGDHGSPIFYPGNGTQVGTIVAGIGNCSAGGHSFGLPLN